MSRLGPLGRRLLGVFVLVTLFAVVVVAVAGLVGSSLGVAQNQAAEREKVLDDVNQAAARAYSSAGGWAGADLRPAQALATAAGAGLLVQDGEGATVLAVRRGLGSGPLGPGTGVHGSDAATPSGTGRTRGDVVVDGRIVGSVTLGFGPTATTGRGLAWSWIVVAAIIALAAAVVAAFVVVRSLTRPLTALTEATRAFGGGDTRARPQVRGVGELAELATAFDDAAVAVERSDRIRRQMAADVAHELRTPLSALQAGLEELRDGLVPADAESLTRLHDQALRLGRSVQDLSDLSAADAAAAQLDLAPVDLGDLARSAVSERTAQLRSAGLTVTTDGIADGVVVLADANRTHQVVGNLLDNCARHCRRGDEVHVTVNLAAGSANGRMGELVVRDTGPGIPPEDLEHVLERFWRGRDRAGVAGSGVGLAVVARLAEAHRGEVAVDSDGHNGTTVTVRVPLAQ